MKEKRFVLESISLGPCRAFSYIGWDEQRTIYRSEAMRFFSASAARRYAASHPEVCEGYYPMEKADD